MERVYAQEVSQHIDEAVKVQGFVVSAIAP